MIYYPFLKGINKRISSKILLLISLFVGKLTKSCAVQTRKKDNGPERKSGSAREKNVGK